MKNVVLTGIGGQGTVLAAKILAQAAQVRESSLDVPPRLRGLL